MFPLFSLITVSHNSSKTISDTIQSVLNQTYNDIEYIIVDGNSKDNTVDIIKEYEPKFNGRMLWISEPDKGLYGAMNKGIRMATGDVVGIINSDDFYHRNDIISIVANEFKRDLSLQAVYGDVRFVNEKNTDKTVRYYSSRLFRPWLFRFGFMPAHPSFFTFRENYFKYGLYKIDYKIAADYELLIRFLYVFRIKSKYISTDFLKMRLGGESTASIKSNYVLNQEIVRACKENNLFTSIFLLPFKYVFKVWELVFLRNK